MKTKIRSVKLVALLLPALGALALQGCGTINSSSSNEIKFPAISDSYLKSATYPTVDNVRQMGLGLGKTQVYNLLGVPHFSEGMFGVHQWDYIFKFRQADGKESDTCQYQVQYDKDYKTKALYWNPATCAEYLIEKPTVATERVVERVEAVPAVAPKVKVYRLDADALFKFDKGDLPNMLPGGLSKVQALGDELKAANNLIDLRVIGYTDEIGSPNYNQRLSQQRANTVRNVLVNQGVEARMSAEGRGESNPIVQCAGSKATPTRINCLAPNRRVEIEAVGID